MSESIISVRVDTTALENKLKTAANPDDKIMLYAHQQFAKYCAPYVPMETGTLVQSVDIKPEFVEWKQPYAHYMYMGEIYGPNIPIKDAASGMVIGYFSPPGKTKTPTGRNLTYSKEMNPNASDHWDVTAMLAHMQDLLTDIGDFIARRMNGGDQSDQ